MKIEQLRSSRQGTQQRMAWPCTSFHTPVAVRCRYNKVVSEKPHWSAVGFGQPVTVCCIQDGISISLERTQSRQERTIIEVFDSTAYNLELGFSDSASDTKAPRRPCDEGRTTMVGHVNAQRSVLLRAACLRLLLTKVYAACVSKSCHEVDLQAYSP